MSESGEPCKIIGRWKSVEYIDGFHEIREFGRLIETPSSIKYPNRADEEDRMFWESNPSALDVSIVSS